MNRTRPGKEFVLVAWKDSDVQDIIKDKSFAGKLMDKENQPENAKTGTLKKKRISKRPSMVSNAELTASDLAHLGLTGAGVKLTIDNDSGLPSTITEVKQQPPQQKLLNHFVFGTSGHSSGDSLMGGKTSNNRLDQSYKISYAEMNQVLKTYKSPLDETVTKLGKNYQARYFNEWTKLMKFGFNILLHGVGSKKKLLENFCENQLANEFYIELLGFHHDFNTKSLLKNILIEVLGLQEVYKTTEEQMNAIRHNLKVPLYLIVHNIDGNCMRDVSMQYLFCELAAIKHVHLIASVDHINSSLLWDHMQYVSFNWVSYEVNTLEPYHDEIVFENSLLLNQTGNVQLSSMIHILKSLTQNAKNVFLIMVQHVLNPDNLKKSITFTKLYHECRERFYVSNELTLRAQLTEFIDHKLIKLKKESDGYETIYLLIDDDNLKLYLEDIKDKV